MITIDLFSILWIVTFAMLRYFRLDRDWRKIDSEWYRRGRDEEWVRKDACRQKLKKYGLEDMP